MTTEIIVAIIGAVAVVAAAIIKVMTTKSTKEKSSVGLNLQQQNANIQGDFNDIEQTVSASDCSQSATIKGNNNFIKQNKI